MSIRWSFISELEGGRRLKGYVPAADVSESGVTIATGVDLGQRSASSIDALSISDHLKAKLKPYVGLKKQAALDLLATNPLEISEAEGGALDAAIKEGAVSDIRASYDRAVAQDPAEPSFNDLSEEARTVICSVAFQYGADLRRRTPKFWRACTEGRWNDAVGELRNFGDDYPTRRNKEADLLSTSVEVMSHGAGRRR